jgi:hypothetical protein
MSACGSVSLVHNDQTHLLIERCRPMECEARNPGMGCSYVSWT